ncbi:hypothetical protein UPYG_G00304250 [Umbra pygmaea]|uniref:IRG-type G domain-containing protein n=1 Tax=Umbra pygmaea TaxID=75934 RepID=A0ABD0W2R0_UMBPY
MDQELDIITDDDINTARRELQEVLENGTLTSAAGQIQDYLEKVQNVELNIAVTGESGSVRFRNNDVLLAKEIQKMNRKFYFVRSKIDASLAAEKRKKNFNRDETLKQIKENSIQGLEKEGLGSPKVFLVSSFDLQLFDFPVLEETMEKELPDHKKEVLLMCIPNLTLEINERKRNALGVSVWKAAFKSGVAGAVPIPGVSIIADIKILTDEIEKYYQAFGLDNESLQNLADKMGLRVEELNAVIKSPLHTAGGLAFGTTYHMLKSCLNELAEDAKNVLMKSLEPKTETK